MTARDTFGVGTRIALPVSLPCSSGRHLATAFAAPVSVTTMLRGTSSAAAFLLVVVVDQVLVVREGVDRLDVPAVDLELVVDRLQHRHDRVGRTGGRREDLARLCHAVVVHTVDDVRDVALAGCGQNDLRGAGNQMLGEILFGPPLACCRRRLHPGCRTSSSRTPRAVRIDHVDEIAVDDQRVVLVIDGHLSGEGAVDRVTAEQARTLSEVVVATGADDDRAQAQVVAAAPSCRRGCARRGDRSDRSRRARRPAGCRAGSSCPSRCRRARPSRSPRSSRPWRRHWSRDCRGRCVPGRGRGARPRRGAGRCRGADRLLDVDPRNPVEFEDLEGRFIDERVAENRDDHAAVAGRARR